SREGLVTELVNVAFTKLHGAFAWQRTFRNDDNAVLLAHLEATFHRLADLCNIERYFWNNGVVSTAGHTCVQSNPTHVAAHDLHDHHTVVRFSGGVQAVNSVGSHCHSSIETEGEVSAIHVIVNGLWDTDNR